MHMWHIFFHFAWDASLCFETKLWSFLFFHLNMIFTSLCEEKNNSFLALKFEQFAASAQCSAQEGLFWSRAFSRCIAKRIPASFGLRNRSLRFRPQPHTNLLMASTHHCSNSSKCIKNSILTLQHNPPLLWNEKLSFYASFVLPLVASGTERALIRH